MQRSQLCNDLPVPGISHYPKLSFNNALGNQHLNFTLAKHSKDITNTASSQLTQLNLDFTNKWGTSAKSSPGTNERDFTTIGYSHLDGQLANSHLALNGLNFNSEHMFHQRLFNQKMTTTSISLNEQGQINTVFSKKSDASRHGMLENRHKQSNFLENNYNFVGLRNYNPVVLEPFKMPVFPEHLICNQGLNGLEQVAEELVGADTMNKLLEPFNNRESREHSEHTDWEPCDTCYFCQSRTKMLFEALQQSYKQQAEEQQLKEQQQKEQQAKQLQEQQQKLLEQHQEQQQTEKQPAEEDECNSEGATVTEEPGMKYLAQLLPFSYPLPLAFLPPKIENNMSGLHSPPSDAPLDLSASSRQHTKVEPDDQNRPPSMELKVPQVKKSGKRKDGSLKRNYTQEELSAALDDIRSGKLGTRRAAVLYGIPRSTLRNKICKISTEKQEPGEPKLSMADLVQNGDFSMAEDSRSTTGEAEEEPWEQKLEKLRKKHNISLGNERDFPGVFNPYMINPLLDPNQPYGLTDAYSHELKLPLLPDLVRRLAEQRMELERAQNMSLMPVMPMALSLLSKPMEHESSEIREPSDYSARPSPPSPPSPASPTATSTPLKIPSFKPSRSIAETSVTPTRDLEKITQSSLTTGKIGDTLKDIIAKTIAEKVRSKTQVDDMYSAMPFSNYTFPSGIENGHNLSTAFQHPQHSEPVVAPPPPVKRQRTRPATVANALAKKDDKPVDGTKPVKKTRPKRGQYRKYNSQLLLEAVRAVQRGEMSVHRAGSYFGVPHSTLEYKVKERHLLRQKKVAEQKAAAEAAALAASENQRSATGSEDVSGDNLSTSPAPGTAPVQNGTLPTEGDYGAAGFALNTSASELLKKLQQKVQAKAMAGIENGVEETSSQPERMETTNSGDVVVVQ